MKFPTTDHVEAAQLVADFTETLEDVDTILVVNSCARDQAVADSDLDMAILINGHFDESKLESVWQTHLTSNAALQAFIQRGPFSAVHLDFFDGTFEPAGWDDGGGPDDFEIEIGNRIAYAVPLVSDGPYFQSLKARWLPYYNETLRTNRLAMAQTACLSDLDHIRFFQDRSLFLQAFDRLYKAFREYLQALFIASGVYPIAYNKWLHEQLTMIGKSELFEPLLTVLSVNDLTSRDLKENGDLLKELAVDVTRTTF